MDKLINWTKKHYPKLLPVLMLALLLNAIGSGIEKIISATNKVGSAVTIVQKHNEAKKSVTAELTNGNFQFHTVDLLAVTFDNPTDKTQGVDNVLIECSKRDGTKAYIYPINDDPLPGEAPRGLEIMPIAIPAGVPRKIQFLLRKNSMLEPSRDCSSLRVAWTDSNWKAHFGDALSLDPNEVFFSNTVFTRG